MEVDFLILADSAQVAGSKLYLLGGGWNRIYGAQFPTNHHLGVAAGILVGWDETNEEHHFKLQLRNEDAHKEMATLEGKFNQGRPPDVARGEQQRVIIASEVTLALEGPGSCVAELSLDGDVHKTTPFDIVERRRNP
jgi:hypothetical protein